MRKRSGPKSRPSCQALSNYFDTSKNTDLTSKDRL